MIVRESALARWHFLYAIGARARLQSAKVPCPFRGSQRNHRVKQRIIYSPPAIPMSYPEISRH